LFLLVLFLLCFCFFIHLFQADECGNLIFRGTANNFSEPMATAGRVVIAEVEEIVAAGALDPASVHVPGIYVDHLVLGKNYQKRIEKRTVQKPGGAAQSLDRSDPRVLIAGRAALEFRDGMYCNLGIGEREKERERKRRDLNEEEKGE
jgi:3-oxoacid CoA-transferase